jgi:molecular chaperone HscB
MNITDDDFTLFSLPERYALDRSDLDRRWRELQAKVHPDRFAAQGPAAQRVAMQWAVRVNEAYQRLRDPLKRAAYLCERRGAPIEAESNTAMPSTFLMDQMVWRESLDDAADLDAVQALDAQVLAQEGAMLTRLQAELDEQGDAAAAAQTVRALMFVQRFRQDLDHRLEALGQ